MEKVLPLEEIFCPGNTVEILYSQNIGSFDTYKATVTAFDDEGISVVINKTEFEYSLEPGAEITIKYSDTNGQEYLFGSYQINQVFNQSMVLLAKPWKTNSSFLQRYFDPQMKTPWKVHQSSLRRYFRVKVQLPFYYLLDGIVHVGQVIDLSVGGLFAIVQPDPRFLLESTLSFQLLLPNNIHLELTGKIMRSQTIENTKLGIGIDFLPTIAEIREEIIRYLLQSKNATS